jgi:acetyltransferase-like isoleucine patch superfamily enzyme
MFKRFQCKPTGSLEIHPAAKFYAEDSLRFPAGRIVVGAGSVVKLGRDVVVEAEIIVGGNCEVIVGDGAFLKNVTFDIRNRSRVTLGAGVIFDSPPRWPNQVAVDGGTLLLEEKAHIQADLLVRFGGRLSIGRHTGIGHGSEIRCEEEITIGHHGLFSYEVCIYDTNTHSTDWRERRERIEAGYPHGTGEIRRPKTSPVRIGDDVWIGKGATITKGAVIGHRCIIGIRTVVGALTVPDDNVVVSDSPRIIARPTSPTET